MIDFKNVKSIIVPEGEVYSIASGSEILWQKSELPIGYQKVEYIEGTGEQYFDTGFIPNSNTRVLVDADVPKRSSGATYVVGTHTWRSGKLYQIRISSAGTVYISDYGSQSLATGVKPAGRMTFDKNKNVCTIDENVATNTEKAFENSTTMLFLAGSTTSNALTISPGKVYSGKVWDDGTLIRDYIACINADGVAGMYDLVSGEFSGSAGSAAFVAGPLAADGAASDSYTYEEAEPDEEDDQTITGTEALAIILGEEGVTE